AYSGATDNETKQFGTNQGAEPDAESGDSAGRTAAAGEEELGISSCPFSSRSPQRSLASHDLVAPVQERLKKVFRRVLRRRAAGALGQPARGGHVAQHRVRRRRLRA